MPGVLFVLPDSYVDPEYKDYGGKFFFEDLMVNHLCVFRYHVLLFKTSCTHN